ncbi:Hpt domain-containing protein [Photobacterium alginatilyticum]|uniref:Hpt domain-containing protein n=1 Tax=Photobacterium alginatilyticum TaxID=1775171 RepID=A0ABW9YCL9_9GAMM|nr:Hpt domain-containing protein [Photobacterium alginatilyticum]NBI51500.1 Hpt domain-containing protein [Photobacterium alginatilyticum]
MKIEEKPVSEFAVAPVMPERSRQAEEQGRDSSPIILVLGLLLLLVGTGVIAYLSMLSASTLSFISSTSQLQNEAEQLRWQVITVPADSLRPVSEQQSELTAPFRSRLTEWQYGDIPASVQAKITPLVKQGNQFADQAEYAWLTRHYVFDKETLLAKGQVTADLTAIKSVDMNPFLASLQKLQSALIQSETTLTWLSLLLAVLVALVGIGGVSYGVVGRRRKVQAMQITEAAPPLLVPERDIREDDEVKGSDVIAEDPEQKARTADSVLDTEQMLDSMDGDRESVVMLLEVFLKEHIDDAKRLSASLERGQCDEVSLISHSLKSVASSFGAGRLRQRAEYIEHCCKQGIAVHAEDIERLDGALKELKAAIVAYLAEEAEREQGAVVVEEMTCDEEVANAEQIRVVAPDVIQDAEIQPVETDHSQIKYFEANSSEIPDITERGSAASESLEADAQQSGPKREDEQLDVLNVAYVMESMDDDVESVKMLFEIFIEEHALDAKKLQQMVYQRAPDDIDEAALRLVHSLKGVASSLGAASLKRQAEIIEKHFKKQQVVADVEYRKLERVLNDTVVAVTHYLTQQAAVVA